MLLAKVNCLFLAILLSFPPTSGLNQLDLLHGEVGDVQDDQEEGGVLLFHLQDHGGQDGREGELQDGVGEAHGLGLLDEPAVVGVAKCLGNVVNNVAMDVLVNQHCAPHHTSRSNEAILCRIVCFLKGMSWQ